MISSCSINSIVLWLFLRLFPSSNMSGLLFKSFKLEHILKSSAKQETEVKHKAFIGWLQEFKLIVNNFLINTSSSKTKNFHWIYSLHCYNYSWPTGYFKVHACVCVCIRCLEIYIYIFNLLCHIASFNILIFFWWVLSR